MKIILFFSLFAFSLPSFASEEPGINLNKDFDDEEFVLERIPTVDLGKYHKSLGDNLKERKKSAKQNVLDVLLDIEGELAKLFAQELIDPNPVFIEADLSYIPELNKELYAAEEISELQKGSLALCAGVSDELVSQLEDTKEVGATKALEAPSILDSVGASNPLLETSNFSEVGASSLLEDSTKETAALEDNKASDRSAIKKLAFSQCMQLTAPKSKKSSAISSKSKSKKKMNLDDLFKVYNKVSKK